MSTLTGKLFKKGDTETFGSSGFRKRAFILETDGNYPQKIQIELIQDKVELIEAFSLGDNITVSYNINGKEWINPEGVAKYFNSISGWRIETSATTKEGDAPASFGTTPVAQNEEPLDLPF